MRRTIIKYAVFFAAYVVVCFCLARYAPDWAAANTFTMSLTVVALSIGTVILSFVNRRTCVRLLDQVTQYRTEGLAAWVNAVHSRYTARDVPDMPALLELVCGCGEAIGCFWRENPDAVFALTKGHVQQMIGQYENSETQAREEAEAK